jgi:UDP-glucose 4-epimerase
MHVLVTGGLGYIGSHTVIQLIEKGIEVVMIDNLSNTSLDVLDKLELLTQKEIPFFEIDCTDKTSLERVFETFRFDAVIHFAGYKAVGESVNNPLSYYHNNVLSTIYLTELSTKYKVKHLIFSSSATVYGNGLAPFKETSPLLPRTNPYGETKAMSEKILMDASYASDLSVTLLRYFNPVGAHASGLIGEKPNGIPNNLMPYMTQVAKKIREKLYVYGNDYETSDGTGVRDYIHVEDLARGHLLALLNLKDKLNIYNLGSGVGTSVLDLIETFKRVNKIDIPYEIAKRRDGDIAISFADSDKAFKELGFKTEKTLEDMVKDAWNFEKNQDNKS